MWSSPTQRILHTIFCFTYSRICTPSSALHIREFVVGNCRENLPWLFTARICRRNLPWEFAARIYHDYLLREFAAGIYRGHLSWLFAVCICKQILFCVCKQILFISKQTFFMCGQNFFICNIFFINSVSFCYCNVSYGPPYFYYQWHLLKLRGQCSLNNCKQQTWSGFSYCI